MYQNDTVAAKKMSLLKEIMSHGMPQKETIFSRISQNEKASDEQEIMSLSIYVYIHIYIYIYVYAYICIYVYTYMYI